MPLNIIRQDITKMKTDAIVAAEGHNLASHGQVGLAIAMAAGEEYQRACEELGQCDTGDAKITKGYDLPAKYVIHTTGPLYQGGDKGEKILLRSCYEKSLSLAKENGCRSIAFPVISTGGYGFPKDEGLKIATDAITGFLEKDDMDVYLVVYDKETTLLSQDLDYEIEEYIDDNYVGEREPGFNNFHSTVRENRNSTYGAAPGKRNKPKRRRLDIAEGGLFEADECTANAAPIVHNSLESALKVRDESFQQMLFRLIVEKDLKNSEVYSRANISKSHFSKIKLNADYKPKKETVFALAVALELSIEETRELMMKAGYAISHSFVLDTIVEYFIVHGRYDITEINFALFDHDQTLLGERPL